MTVTDLAAPCLGCGVDTYDLGEWYMLRDEVWVAAGLVPHGFACLGCVEARLGRRLHSADFTTAPVNEPTLNRHSDRLADRLTHTADGALCPLRDRVEIADGCEDPDHAPGEHECFVPGARCPHGKYLLLVQEQPNYLGLYSCKACHDDAYYGEDF